MNKGLKTFALVGLAACAIGAASALTACDNREKLTIWCAEEVRSLTETQVERYVSQYDDFPYKLAYESVGEGDAVTSVLNDVTAAGDIFFFAQDQLARVVQSGALSAVPDSYREDVIARNDDTSVKAATVGDTLYVYPVTSDNGYFAYYDKSILSESDLATQEGLISALNTYNETNETNYQVGFNLAGSGWYNAAYFFGAGCVTEWQTDENGTFVDYYDTYNSINGYDALEGMAQLMANDLFLDVNAASNFASGAAVVVSGTWDSGTAKQLLGDNFAATKLWTVTVPASTRALYTGDNVPEGMTDSTPAEELDESGNRTYQLGSFSGCKLLGVRRNEDGEKNAWSHGIADYLTSEKCQLERFNSNGWGPSNRNAQKDSGVLEDEALAALNAQNVYATPQGDFPGSWWDNTIVVGTTVQQAGTDVLAAQQCSDILEAYDAQNRAVLDASSFAYSVVGTLDECSWQVLPASNGAPQYALTDSNAEAGTYSVDSDGVIHGKWVIDEVNVIGAGCYVNAEGTYADATDDDATEIGLFRITDYGDWTGNYGYTHLSDKTGYYDWNGTIEKHVDYEEGSDEPTITYGGGADNNVGIIPGTYTVTFDYTGSTPVITIA